MVIVDTTVWIDYLRGTANAETAWLERELEREELGLTDLILCEVLQGIGDPKIFSCVHTELKEFEIFPGVGEEIAVAAARNFQRLRASGITVRRTVDCLIATFCIDKGFPLLHRDRDFDPFEENFGLRVIHA